MLYMMIERFRNGNPVPVYERFSAHGRLAPQGLTYVASWVTTDRTTCFQVMECEDRQLLEDWMSHWNDIVDFEAFPVTTSAEAAEAVLRRS